MCSPAPRTHQPSRSLLARSLDGCFDVATSSPPSIPLPMLAAGRALLTVPPPRPGSHHHCTPRPPRAIITWPAAAAAASAVLKACVNNDCSVHRRPLLPRVGPSAGPFSRHFTRRSRLRRSRKKVRLRLTSAVAMPPARESTATLSLERRNDDRLLPQGPLARHN